MIERILIGLLTGGHVLLEGVPGLAKTLTVRTLCDAIQRASSRASSSRPTCCPPTSIGTVIYNQQTGEFTVQARPDLREPRARRRDQPRARQGAERAARGDAGAPGHHRRHDATRCPTRSSSWPRRTRSSRRAPTRCPRRRSTASCCMVKVGYPTRDEERQIMDRMTGARRRAQGRAGGRRPSSCSTRARSCATSTWTSR